MTFRTKPTPVPRGRNQRLSTIRQRKHQHLLDVKVRSRKANQQRNRKLLSWFSGLLLVFSTIGVVLWGGREALRRFVWENPEYRVADVRIETDGALGRGEVLEAANIAIGVNIFSINIADARRSLLVLPQVETAEITRTLPNRIAIAITERKPIAWLAPAGVEDPSTSDRSFLVDRRGILISSKHHRPETLHLPIIHGAPIESCEAGEIVDTPEVKAALDLIRLSSENTTQFQVRSIDVSKQYCMVVTDRNRAQITFGLDRIDWQLDRLATVLNHVEHTKQEIQTVNLLVQRNVPVTFVPPPPPVDPALEAEAETAAVLPAAAPKKPEAPARGIDSAPKKSEPPTAKKPPTAATKPAAKTPAKPASKSKPSESKTEALRKLNPFIKKKPDTSSNRHG